VIALGEIGDARAIAPLTHVMKDKDWHVGDEAVRAVEKIKERN
jgi:HEAT repeat protein